MKDLKEVGFKKIEYNKGSGTENYISFLCEK